MFTLENRGYDGDRAPLSTTKTVIIFYELAVVILLISIVFFCARPIVEAFADRMRSQHKLETEQKSPSIRLEKRVAQLESEVNELKLQLKSVQESADFAVNIAQALDKNNVIQLDDETLKQTKKPS
ncbi:MAG: hypothetical protein K2X93_21520 [Candidatus Obscuribacterales bacterium]|nr:hypothetical protein [Candidatus Obscuribacterales bacterium]